MSKAKRRTKEEYFSLLKFTTNILRLNNLFEEYDIDYSLMDDFSTDFYKFLEEKHYITTEQKLLMLNLLRNGDLNTIDDFMDVMIFEFSSDYDDFATISVEQFDGLLSEFFEENQDLGNSLFENLKEVNTDIDWEYLFQ